MVTGNGNPTSLREFRRVVIGDDDQGRARVEVDELISPQLEAVPGHLLADLWEVNLTDSKPAASAYPVDRPYRLADHAGDIIAKKVIWPPQAEIDRHLDAHPEAMGAVRSELSLPETETSIPNVIMHATETIDFIWILSGEITCVLEGEEVTLREGDTLVQRGSTHGWINRGTVPCVIACAMISSKPLACAE